MRIRSNVLDHSAASPDEALSHFRAKMAYEADCSDVYADLAAGVPGFTVVDTRSADHYARAHVPGAITIPHRRLSHERLAELGVPETDVLVTYCAGPHCNASTRGAIRAAELGRAVKEMPGGLLGWIAEDFPVATGDQPSSLRRLAG